MPFCGQDVEREKIFGEIDESSGEYPKMGWLKRKDQARCFHAKHSVVIGTNETDTTPGKSESWFQRRTVTLLGKFPL